MFPEIEHDRLPWVDTDQMREVDRLMIEEYSIALVQMMENAGRNLADLVMARFDPSSVSVVAGTGGNGGGVLVAARHLHNRGLEVTVSVTRVGAVGSAQALRYDEVVNVGVDVLAEPREADIVLDGVIGYSLQGAPRGRAAELIEWCAGRDVVSLDTPSGLDTTSGVAPGPVVEAVATATLAAPKVGLRDQEAVGELYLLDISVPPALWQRIEVASPPPLSPISRIV